MQQAHDEEEGARRQAEAEELERMARVRTITCCALDCWYR